MAEPETPFPFENNSGIRSGGSCKNRQEWIEANPDVSMMSSCPNGEEILLKKLENGTFVFETDVFHNFEHKWETVNPNFDVSMACKFYKL